MVEPSIMCRQHLLGEHAEVHYARMMVDGERKTCQGRYLQWYIDHGLVELQSIRRRHDALVAEMEHRGYNHQSPMDWETNLVNAPVDRQESLKELLGRCSACRERHRQVQFPSNVIPMRGVE